MITQKDIQECNAILDAQETTASLPTLQEQIDAQRKLVYEGDLEVARLEQALPQAREVAAKRRQTLSELLNLWGLQKAQENAAAVGPQIPRWG